MEERLDIDTPEGVVFGYQVAGIGSRFMAALADTILLGVLSVAFSCGFSAFTTVTSDLGLGAWMAALNVLASFVLIWGYYIFFEMLWNGQSPGKRWAGLRVVQTSGTPITLFDSLIRNLVRIIDFLPFFYAVGLVSMFLSAQSRRLGDYASGTLVVKERRDVTLEGVQQALRAGVFSFDTSSSLELSQDDYRLITDFMGRRYNLRNRDELALRIGVAIAAKLGLPQPRSVIEAEELLTRLAHRSPRQ